MLDSILLLFIISICMGTPPGIIYSCSFYKSNGGTQQEMLDPALLGDKDEELAIKKNQDI